MFCRSFIPATTRQQHCFSLWLTRALFLHKNLLSSSNNFHPTLGAYFPLPALITRALCLHKGSGLLFFFSLSLLVADLRKKLLVSCRSSVFFFFPGLTHLRALPLLLL